MDEFELIGHYFAQAQCARTGDSLVLGIGDDCALLQCPPAECLAVSTDTVVEGVHFPHDADPYLLGQRCLAVAASDLAAMGAAPMGFTLGLTLSQAQPEWLKAFSEGLESMAAYCGLRLAGGDTTRGPLAISVTVMGHVPQQQALTRRGAQVGDLLCVGGSLGDGAGALPLVLGEPRAWSADEAWLLDRFWAPQPQLALGLALRGRATSAMDISDGLLADCGHLAKASRVQLRVDQQHLPLSDALTAVTGERAVRYALCGGDDYRLVFTASAEHVAVLQAEGWSVHVIGDVVKGEGVQLLDAGQPIDMPGTGFLHFTHGTGASG